MEKEGKETKREPGKEGIYRGERKRRWVRRRGKKTNGERGAGRGMGRRGDGRESNKWRLRGRSEKIYNRRK